MNLVCVSLRVVDKHDSFPVEVVKNVDDEQSQRVEVCAHARQHRELVQTIDGVIASHCRRRQHGCVPVTRLTGDRCRRVVAARPEKRIHLELRKKILRTKIPTRRHS